MRARQHLHNLQRDDQADERSNGQGGCHRYAQGAWHRVLGCCPRGDQGRVGVSLRATSSVDGVDIC